ncbi:LOW QUALITY PROTEIN: hypothetical protein TorRG33x02_008590 [Trema orientale]|uniref:Uncharacterized protein n=1 Tax=Trema orientale TaxID=63057 RepID=A0A2P5G0S7_TREOI|nr:LOW QUALITY PROTEIN: hypothetical protein TorRG33x02_008590 [Trema orientale]
MRSSYLAANLLFASSKSHCFMTPLEAPARTSTSAESKATDSTGLVCPDRLCSLQINTKCRLWSVL